VVLKSLDEPNSIIADASCINLGVAEDIGRGVLKVVSQVLAEVRQHAILPLEVVADLPANGWQGKPALGLTGAAPQGRCTADMG
jgi:hypothetical protein